MYEREREKERKRERERERGERINAGMWIMNHTCSNLQVGLNHSAEERKEKGWV